MGIVVSIKMARIGIGKEEDLSLRMLGAVSQRVILSGPTGRQFRRFERCEVRNLLGQSRQNLRRVVFRMVVDHKDFRHPFLPGKRPYHALHIFLFVANGNDDRNFRWGRLLVHPGDTLHPLFCSGGFLSI